MILTEKQLSLLAYSALELKQTLERIVNETASKEDILNLLLLLENNAGLIHTEINYDIKIQDDEQAN